MDKKGRLKKLIVVICTMLIVGFLTTIFISYQLARASMREQIVSSSLPLTSDNIYSELQRDLIQPIFISSLMAQDTFVRDWIIGGENDVEQIKKYLSEIKVSYNTHSCFLVSDKTRRYYYPDGILKDVHPDVEADAWYFRVKEIATDYEINVDPDLASKNTMTIFINYKVFDYNHEYIGATGVGLKVRALRDLLKQYSQKYQRNIYLTDPAGKIILSSGAASASIQEIEGMNPIAHAVLSGEGGAFDYKSRGEMVFLNSRFVEELNWYLLVEERESFTTKRISNALFMNLIICGLVTLATGFVIYLSIRIYENSSREQGKTIISQHNQLEKSNEELKESNKKKNLLLHILCHDLANPFGALISSMSMLEEDSDLLAELLPEIKKSLDNGIGTIGLVREMRALEEGKINLPVESFALEPLIEESLTMLKAVFNKKSISVKMDIARDIRVSVERISFNNTVLNNLLTNAVKFSEKGADVRIYAMREEKGLIKLTIADDGIGMPESILSALFNLESNITRTGTNGELGTGFGMPLVEQIIKIYGDRIEVYSKDIEEFPEEHGTQVVLFLNA